MSRYRGPDLQGCIRRGSRPHRNQIEVLIQFKNKRYFVLASEISVWLDNMLSFGNIQVVSDSVYLVNSQCLAIFRILCYYYYCNNNNWYFTINVCPELTFYLIPFILVSSVSVSWPVRCFQLALSWVYFIIMWIILFLLTWDQCNFSQEVHLLLSTLRADSSRALRNLMNGSPKEVTQFIHLEKLFTWEKKQKKQNISAHGLHF